MGICSFTAMGNSSQRPELASDSTPVLYGSKLSIHFDFQRPDPYLAEALQLLNMRWGCSGARWPSSGPSLLLCCCRSNRELSCKKTAVVTANFAYSQIHKRNPPFYFRVSIFNENFKVSMRDKHRCVEMPLIQPYQEESLKFPPSLLHVHLGENCLSLLVAAAELEGRRINKKKYTRN